ncbi:MAG: hypothetical protein ACYC09_00790 [Bacteroidota bacterium]
MTLFRPVNILLILALSVYAYGQQDDFPEGVDESDPALEWSGNFDAKYTFFHMDKTSPLYALQFLKQRPATDVLTQYRLEPYLNAEYRSDEIGFVLKTHALYYSEAQSSVDLFEAYGTINPSINTTVQAGKRVYSWGKGYAFNPVGFVNPVKDPENPELAMAGTLSAHAEYIKSFSSELLQSMSFTAIVIPSANISGTPFGEWQGTDIALKTYALLWDTDIDVMVYYSDDNPQKYGFDFARNIRENVEIHGEFGAIQNLDRYTIENGVLTGSRVNETVYLMGLRYLDESNTTIITEYYHNGAGLSKQEYKSLYGFLTAGANSGIPLIAQQTFSINQTYFKGNSLMQDYLYIKAMRPEPFDWLYFTPSVHTIYNLNDNSYLLSFQISYKPIINTDFIFWTTFFGGSSDSEFGGKQVKERLDLWMRIYF